MKNQLKLILAVFVFTLTSLVSIHNSYAKAVVGGGPCDSSDAECGTDFKGGQICGKYVGPQC